MGNCKSWAMDRDFTPLDSYEHMMSRSVRTWKHKMADVIFPFRMVFRSPETQMVDIVLRPGAYVLSLSLLFGLLLFLPYAYHRKLKPSGIQLWGLGALCAFTGIYGIICALFIEEPAI